MRRRPPPPFRRDAPPARDIIPESAFGTAPGFADWWAGGARRKAFLRHLRKQRVGEWADRAVFALFRALPAPVASALGAFLGRRFARRTDTRQHAMALANLRRLRPDLDDVAGAAMIVANRETGGRTFAEAAHLRALVRSGRVAVRGLDHLDAALARGPVVLVGLHLDTWEIGAAVFPALMPGFHSFYAPLASRARHRIIVRAREAAGCTLLPPSPTGVRRALAALKAGGGVAVFCDELGPDRVSRAPFFFKPPRTDGNLSVATRLARLSGATLLPWTVERIGSARLVLAVHAPVRLAAAEDDPERLLKDVVQLNAVIEPLVRERLAGWFWLDNRLEG